MTVIGQNALVYGETCFIPGLQDGLTYSAETPQVFDRTTGQVAGAWNIPIDNIIDYAADIHGEDPNRLGQIAVILRDTSSMPGHIGAMIRDPSVIGGLLRYPIIDLAITEQSSGKSLNATMHHEMRHVFQARVKEPLYYQDRALRIAKVSRNVGVVAGLVLGIKGFTDVVEYTNRVTQGIEHFENSAVEIRAVEMLAGLGSATISTMSSARSALWKLDRQERDAEKYAKLHSKYRPITAN